MNTDIVCDDDLRQTLSVIRGCICSPPSGTPDMRHLSAGYARPKGLAHPRLSIVGPLRGPMVGTVARMVAGMVGATLVVARPVSVKGVPEGGEHIQPRMSRGTTPDQYGQQAKVT